MHSVDGRLLHKQRLSVDLIRHTIGLCLLQGTEFALVNANTDARTAGLR